MDFLQKTKKVIIFLIKAVFFASLVGSFFLIMGIRLPQLLRPSRTLAVTLLIYVVVGVALLGVYGSFDIGKRKSKPIISSIGLATVLTDIVSYIQLLIMSTNETNGFKFRLENFGLFIVTVAVHIILIVIFTYFGNWVFFKLNDPEKCVLITSGVDYFGEAISAIGKFKKQFDVVFICDYRSRDYLEQIVKCDTVFLYSVPVKERTEIIEFCYNHLKNVYFNPEVADISEMYAKHVLIDDISFVYEPVKQLNLGQRFIKRSMDIIISIICLIVLSPVMLIIAIRIKADDGGKVIYKQKRATINGRVFDVYKFRTMKPNDENHPAVSDDDRITKAGASLRKYRLDEIPQFLNVLKGEMSLVGPRPEMLDNVFLYIKECPEFSYRFRVKAGITGYAQIAGKYNTTPMNKLILDMMYIEHYSIFRDIKLLLQTLIVLFKKDSTEAF
ncbi:MAG: sugar transferase, partial [Lachnospiraceae bacterium]|nr:sugar transferase [Lachnospiraceae bacterium]